MDVNYHPYYHSSWALVIGINAYQYVSPLSFAGNDADAVATMLVNELDFPKENVIVLKDSEATKQEIMDRFLRFAESACDPDDRVLVFFAGHGYTIDGLRGPIGYLVPVNGSPDNKNSLIRWDDLTRNAELIPAKHILFIMDACYSGLALQRAITPGAQRFVSDMLQRLARQVITAGKADEVVADGGGPQGNNSIFTGYLIDGLKGAAVDPSGILTANELMIYVYNKVGQDSHSKQTPHYGHLDGDGDFILHTPNREHLISTAQKEYLVKISEEKPEISQVTTILTPKPSFFERNGYGDPTNPYFGRNEWSKKLGEYRRGSELPREISKAFSWLSLIIEPVTEFSRPIDIAVMSEKLRNYQPLGDNPYEQLVMPRKLMTTIDSVVLYEELSYNSEYWGRYIRLDKQGNIEYTDSLNMFIEIDGIRSFCYVMIIGSIWQFMFFAKHILSEVGYDLGLRLWVNLVGTKDSILADFSKEKGENGSHWKTPFDRTDPFDRGDLLNLKCLDPNLQMDYQFIIDNLDENSSLEIIKSAAANLSLAYNHQSQPRCFNYNTEVFPWNQFFTQRRLFAP